MIVIVILKNVLILSQFKGYRNYFKYKRNNKILTVRNFQKFYLRRHFLLKKKTESKLIGPNWSLN